MYIYCIHLFMSLFIIPSQSVFGKNFAKPLAKAFRKTSSDSIVQNIITINSILSQCQIATLYYIDTRPVELIETLMY